MAESEVKLWGGLDRPEIDMILDHLIPPDATGKVPGAGQLGIGDHLSEVAKQNSEIQKAITNCFETIASANKSNSLDDAIKHCEVENPSSFRTMLRHVYMGYYSRRDTRPLFGLNANPPQPDGYQVPEETPEFMEKLVEAVRSRGKCYRDVDLGGEKS